MKTFVLGLTFLGFTILMQSQNDMASVQVDLNDYVKSSKNEAINSTYFYSFDDKISSERIRNFQNVVANYDIKTSSVYTSDDTSNYKVVFTEGANEIIAQFNHNGKIVECKESFKDIKLPYAISSSIAKSYPGWKFIHKTCDISYSKDNAEEVIYKVTIENGNKRKTLKLNAAVYIP